MSFFKRLRSECKMLWWEIECSTKYFFGRRRSFILWRWQKLWIRKDEFHSSLNLDPQILLYLTLEEQKDYCRDLFLRRQFAHKRDLAKKDKKFADN